MRACFEVLPRRGHQPKPVDQSGGTTFVPRGVDKRMYGRILPAGDRKTGYDQRMPMTTLQEIIDAARTLSPAERLRLVDAVWDDEHPENWPALSPEWLAEVQRRSAEFDAGRMKASPWEEVQARVRRKAGLDG